MAKQMNEHNNHQPQTAPWRSMAVAALTVVLVGGPILIAQAAPNCVVQGGSFTACSQSDGEFALGNCPDRVVTNSGCENIAYAASGVLTIDPYDSTCVYQPRKKNPNGPGCVDDGGQVTYTARCNRPGVGECPTSGGGGGVH